MRSLGTHWLGVLCGSRAPLTASRTGRHAHSKRCVPRSFEKIEWRSLDGRALSLKQVCYTRRRQAYHACPVLDPASGANALTGPARSRSRAREPAGKYGTADMC